MLIGEYWERCSHFRVRWLAGAGREQQLDWPRAGQGLVQHLDYSCSCHTAICSHSVMCAIFNVQTALSVDWNLQINADLSVIVDHCTKRLNYCAFSRLAAAILTLTFLCSLQDVTEALLLMCNSRLQPPLFARLYNAAKQLSLTTGIGTAMYDKKTHMYHIQQVLEQLPPHR